MEAALAPLPKRLAARVRKKLLQLDPKQLQELEASHALQKFVDVVAKKEQAILDKKDKQAASEGKAGLASEAAAEGTAASTSEAAAEAKPGAARETTAGLVSEAAGEGKAEGKSDADGKAGGESHAGLSPAASPSPSSEAKAGKAEGGEAKAEGGEAKAEGGEAKAEGGEAKAEGGEAKAEGGEAKAEGGEAKAEGGEAKAEGGEAKAEGGEAKAEGGEAKAEGGEAKAEGGEAKAEGGEAKAEGGEAKAEGGEAKAEGGEAKAEGGEAKAEGGEAKAEGGEAKAEGGEAKAEGGEAKAEGGEAKAEGGEAKAEGGEAKAEGGGGAPPASSSPPPSTAPPPSPTPAPPTPADGAAPPPRRGGRRLLNVNIGVLGHVDSGKTSLCRSLSSVASTAAFDKHPQSKERGITLDLGFSSFVMELPAHLHGAPYDGVQVTLVDCPGHASLIRTIIGGAQIIDLMMLVVDVGKGIQTQTAECLVIGEITNEAMIVVLNKLDVLPEETREKKLAAMEARIRKTLAATKFHDAPIVGVAARPGGAATAAGDTEVVESVGIAKLAEMIKSRLRLPDRAPDGPFMFAIDHCFPIKGQGTVLTGTVLSGSVKVGQEIELPELKITRKVKSMQMFRQPVQSATQGDRLGLCVTQLDAKSLERGIACSAGHVTLVSAAIISVRQIRFFKAACRTRSKFHVTIGHTTVMGSATFFGPPKDESPVAALEAQMASMGEEELAEAKQAASVALAKTPLQTSIDLSREYEYQDELNPMRPDQWAVLQFEQPLPCAVPSVLIGSHLDSDTNLSTCRLAFHGRLLQSVTPEEVARLRIFKRKLKEGQIERVQDERTVICKNLFLAGTDMNLFLGMTVQLGENGPTGRIDGTFGKSKFKVAVDPLEGGLAALQDACKGAKLYLRYKRFVFDPKKRMIQTP